MISKILVNGEEKYAVTGVFGEMAVRYVDELNSRSSEKKIDAVRKKIDDCGEEMFRYFDTKPECEAYLQGLRDMAGYEEFATTSIKLHFKLFPDTTNILEEIS